MFTFFSLLSGKCLTKCVVYKATVTEIGTNKHETYMDSHTSSKLDLIYINRPLN